MFTRILEKLLDKTNIHGTEQATDNRKPVQIAWLLAVLVLAGFSIFQIVGLTRTFVLKETTFSNHNYDVSSWDDLSKYLKVMYCAPDWMDEMIMKENNASALSLLIALSELIDQLHPRTFRLLFDLLNEEEAKLVSYQLEHESYEYGALGWITINKSHEESKNILSNELTSQNVATPLDLVKKFTSLRCDYTKIAIREGMVCQIMEELPCYDYGTELSTYFETTSTLDHHKHNVDSEFFEIPKFILLFEPAEIDMKNRHARIDLFSFATKTNILKEANGSNDSLDIKYESVISVAKTTYLSTKYRKCTHRKHAIFKKAKLVFACMSVCQYNPMTDYSTIDDIESFLNYTSLPSFTLFSDTTKPTLTFFELNKDEVAACQEKCRKMERSCEEIDVRVKPLTHEIVKGSDRNDSYLVRNRYFGIIIDSFAVSQEREVLTFDSYVGAVGGSLGVCLGASLVSLFQLFINCLMFFRCWRTGKKENGGS